jgi:hypothetical protein
MSVQGLHIVHTYLQWTLDPQYAVCAADCIDLSPCWCQHQLHSNTKRLPMLSNVCICKYRHNDKLTSQPYKDTGTSCSRESTTFMHINMLTYWPFCNSKQPFIIQIGAFCHAQKHYGSHGRSMKKRGQCSGSQFVTPPEIQSFKFLQWPNPLQQPSVRHLVTKGYLQFLKSATHQ